jgi:hypothetical protein
MSEFAEEEFFTVGGDADRVTVTIRVAGDDLDPDEVTKVLNISPTFAARKGDRRPSGDRDIVQGTGIWTLTFSGTPSEWTLDEAIPILLDKLPADLAVWDRLAEKYDLDVFCGLQLECWNRGFALSPELLLRLAQRHLELDVDIYYVGSDEAAT